MKCMLPFFALAALLAPTFPALAEVVFRDSFESPPVTGRTPKAAGGDPAKANPADLKPGEKPAWSCLQDQPDLGNGGSVVAGLTNQTARTGTQALYVEATRLSAPYIGVLWVTRSIPIEGGACYKACIWGQNDPKKPLTSTAAQLFLRIQVDFFLDAGQTEMEESHYLIQPLPGGKGRPPLLLFTEWRPVSFRFRAPAQAQTMRVSFRCDSSAEKEAVTGAVYWDDFTVETDQPLPQNAGEALPENTPAPFPSPCSVPTPLERDFGKHATATGNAMRGCETPLLSASASALSSPE